VSTRVEGGTTLIMVTVHATLDAGPAHLVLFIREGPTPGTWRYNLSDAADRRIQCGRIAGKTDHMDVLRYAADRCRDAYEPGTTERGLLEQFAESCGVQHTNPRRTMSSDQGHGVAVETDRLLSALIPTRTLQHALEVLWDNLPPDLETDALRDAFYELDEKLRKTALANIRRGVLPRDYFILSSTNPMNPPGPEDIEKLAAALRTLDDLGLIITL
jgi:hypothetical protein